MFLLWIVRNYSQLIFYFKLYCYQISKDLFFINASGFQVKIDSVKKNLKIISDIDLHLMNENTNLMNNQIIFPGE